MVRIEDEKILAALLAAGSIRRAAKTANVSESTIRNRLKDDAFRKLYEEQKAGILSEACDALCARLTAAVDALSDVICDKKNPATARISAADSVLRHGLRYVEIANVIHRLDALEAAQRNEE